MAEDMRELLRDAAPRPNREPDFERLWSRGRRQRRMTRLAGAASAVVLLGVGGAGLAQLTAPGPRDVQVVDEPGPDVPGDDAYDLDELLGRGQDFGEGESPGGVGYVGRLRVRETSDRTAPESISGQYEVCITLRVGPQDEQSTANGCGALEQYLEHDRTLWAYTQDSGYAAVAGWLPHEADHAIWELADQEQQIDVLEASGLPGSVFVTAIDAPPQANTAIVLYDDEGAQLDRIELEAQSLTETDPDNADDNATATGDQWLTESERNATQDEQGDGSWIVGYFYPDDADAAGPDFADRLAPRWLRIDDEDLDRQAQLREALAALAGPPPTGMTDNWQADDLRLELDTAELEGQELTLDFERLDARANGTTHAMAMQAQFDRLARHYYPEADTICVFEEGEPTVWLHDMLSCPSNNTAP